MQLKGTKSTVCQKGTIVNRLLPVVLMFGVLSSDVRATDCSFLNRPEVGDAFRAWLHCEECDSSALDALAATEDLVACFDEVLTALDTEISAHYRPALEAAYRKMATFYKENPDLVVGEPLVSEDDYVNMELANRVTRVRIRAAAAISAYPSETSAPILERASEQFGRSKTPSGLYLQEFVDRKRQPDR